MLNKKFQIGPKGQAQKKKRTCLSCILSVPRILYECSFSDNLLGNCLRGTQNTGGKLL